MASTPTLSDAGGGASLPPLLVPLTVVAAAERTLKRLSGVGNKQLNIVLCAEMDSLWPTKTLRFCRRILWAHITRLSEDPALPICLNLVSLCSESVDMLKEHFKATPPAAFLMEDPEGLAIRLQQSSAYHKPSSVDVESAQGHLGLLEYGFWHTKLRALVNKVPLVHFSDTEAIGSGLSGITQTLICGSDRLQDVKRHLLSTATLLDGLATTAEHDLPAAFGSFSQLMEAALMRARGHGIISAELQLLLSLHSNVLTKLPLCLRALAPITGSWQAEVADVLEAVIDIAMGLMGPSPSEDIMDPSSADPYDPRLLAFLSLPKQRRATVEAIRLSSSAETLGDFQPWEVLLEPARGVEQQPSTLRTNNLSVLRQTTMFAHLEAQGVDWGQAEAVFANGPLQPADDGRGSNPHHPMNGGFDDVEAGLHSLHCHSNRPLSLVQWYKELGLEREGNISEVRMLNC
eukprot:scaffold114385_cov44-Prasinocladus_malaysianus.AAC.2